MDNNEYCGAEIFAAFSLKGMFNRNTPEGEKMHQRSRKLANAIGITFDEDPKNRDFFVDGYHNHIKTEFRTMIDGLDDIDKHIAAEVDNMRRTNSTNELIGKRMVDMANNLVPSMFFDPTTRTFTAVPNSSRPVRKPRFGFLRRHER